MILRTLTPCFAFVGVVRSLFLHRNNSKAYAVFQAISFVVPWLLSEPVADESRICLFNRSFCLSHRSTFYTQNMCKTCFPIWSCSLHKIQQRLSRQKCALHYHDTSKSRPQPWKPFSLNTAPCLHALTKFRRKLFLLPRDNYNIHA